jgi:hypothetical protein
VLISLLQNRWGICQNFLLWIYILITRTRSAFELKLQKASKTTDLRIPASVCTMFNVLVDAKKQTTKLCALDAGQEVSGAWSTHVHSAGSPSPGGSLVPYSLTFFMWMLPKILQVAFASQIYILGVVYLHKPCLLQANKKANKQSTLFIQI